jgi:DNA-directed RNA polymerase specialized sigma24 family protein
LVERWQNGDQQAATELVHLYTQRLLALVRSRLSTKLSGRVDPEDVLQSAFRSFFRVAAEPGQKPRPGDDLWHLLAAITLRKVYRQVERHIAAERRSVNREATISEIEGISPAALARGPSPEDQAIVVDELRQAMQQLTPLHRQMVELTLQGNGSVQVATLTKRSDRLVRLVLENFRNQLKENISTLSRR